MLSRQRISLVLVLAVTTALYVYGLDRAPVYLGGDEAHFAIGGYTIAKSGRNVNGDRFPLFFNLADPLGDPVKMPWGDTWYHPILFYLIAAVLKVRAFTEAAVRLPGLAAGGLSRHASRPLRACYGHRPWHWVLQLHRLVGRDAVPAGGIVAGVLAERRRLAAGGARLRRRVRTRADHPDRVAQLSPDGLARHARALPGSRDASARRRTTAAWPISARQCRSTRATSDGRSCFASACRTSPCQRD